MTAGAGAALVAAAGGGGDDVQALLFVLAATLVVAKLLGDLAQRLGQPAVLGEILAGLALGASGLGVLDPGAPVVHALSELGVLVLLFGIGLHTDLRALRTVGAAASAVGLVGVALPFAGGYATATALGLETLPAVVCGAALTATSIGISARVLSDLGRLGTPEGQVTLGAAVLDDVVGLVILAVVAGLAAGGQVDAAGVARIAGVAVGFVVAALVVGAWVVGPALRVVGRLRAEAALGVTALAFAFGLAWLAGKAGSASIIGAFAAGLLLHPTPQRKEIEGFATAVGHLLVPVFFAATGAAVDLRALADGPALALGGALLAVGVAGKVVAGFAPWWFRGDRLLVGLAMVPRGEVGLIFAQMGLASGAIGAGAFGALMVLVLGTTVLTPPLLAWRVRHAPRAEDALAQPGDGGIDDLVAGER